MFKTALCNFYLKKYDEAIFYFNLIIKNSEMNFMENFFLKLGIPKYS
ncbi:MAG: hypothetical protein ACFS24_00170 [Candidatus Karelsulcia muelleri]